MKASPLSILLCGQDAHLLETRKWVLQSRGYTVATVSHTADINLFPSAPSFALLILCHSLSDEEAESATALASIRWPAIRSLVLIADRSRSPSGLLGQLLHTMGGPQNLLSQVSDIIGNGRDQAESKI
jgi:hypothetical protein